MQTIESLNTSISKLEAEVAQLTEKKAHLLTKLQKSDYRKTVKEHITLLHEYNEIRDVGQQLLSKIAIEEQVRQVDVMQRFGVSAND